MTPFLTSTPRKLLPPIRIAILLIVIGILLTAHLLAARLPPSFWWQALIAPDPGNLPQLLMHYEDIPRIAVAWICGAALGLAGVATQQVLRNPLAEPMTLGVFPGAYLALSLATVFAPTWLHGGREAVALAGGAGALMIVFLLGSRRGMSPLSLILGGMIVNLCCGALSFALAIVHYDLLTGMMIWGGGALAQQDWHVVQALLERLVPCVALLLLGVRPLAVFDVGDAVAGSLGVSMRTTRGLALFITVAVTAFVVSAVGVIGFIGLAAPTLARLAGARRLKARLFWAALFGALLLWLADVLSQQVTAWSGTTIPTGAITTLLGAPLLLALLRRLRGRPDIASAEPSVTASISSRALRVIAGLSLGLLVLLIVLSLSVGRGLDGWHISNFGEIADLAFLRLPHVVAAAGVGTLLALAGGVVQRMTGNQMASPDLLGITAGGAFGLTGALFLTAHPGVPTFLFWCASGSMITLCALLLFARASSYAPDTLILAGVTISAVFQAVSVIAIASGDPRVIILYNLLAGSTYNVSASEAVIVAACAFAALLTVPLCKRWLEILPLGSGVAQALGVRLVFARFTLLMFSALLTAAATLVIGPLSFIGLMAPHMARMLGIRRAVPLLFISAVLGASLMVGSDWLGRWVIFPQEMPAGVIATLVGGLYLILTMLNPRAGSRPAS